MSGWDAPTGGSWDSGEEPEGARSDDQGYQQPQPTGGYRAARGDGILRAGRRGLPGYDQAQNYDQPADYGSDPLGTGGYDRGESGAYPAHGAHEASATAWSGADDQDGTQAFRPPQHADAGYGSLPGTGEDYRTQAQGQPGYDQPGYDPPGYASQDYGQGAPGYQTEAYSRQGFESSGYAQRGYADQGYGPSGYGQNGYGQASGGTSTGYQQDSYGQGAYAQDGYGQNGTQAGYVQDGYGQGGYSPDAYRQEAYGQGAHRQDGYGQDGYGQEAYRQETYGQEAYRQETYGQEAYRQDPYRQEAYGQGGYSPDAYRQEAYGQDAYRQDAYRQDGYGQEAYRQDGYRQDGYGQDGYRQEAHAQPGIDQPAGPAYGDDGPGAPAPQSRSGRSRSGKRSPQRLSGIRMVLYLLAAVLGVIVIVWLVINLSKSGSSTTAGSTSSPSTTAGTSTSPGTAAGTTSAFVLTKAAKVGTFPLNPTASSYYVSVAKTQATPYAVAIKAKGAGVPGKEVIALYNLSSVTNVWADDYKAIAFVGYNGTFKPDAVIAYMKTQLTSTRMVSAGPHGGLMMCGYYPSYTTKQNASECLWVTPSTFGMVQFIVDRAQSKYNGTSAVALQVRNAVEVKAS